MPAFKSLSRGLERKGTGEPETENSSGLCPLIRGVTLGKLALCAFILSSVKWELTELVNL